MFEGPHGLVQLFGEPIDFHTADRGFDCVEQTYLKQFCSLIHGQVVIDAVLAIRSDNDLRGDDVARVSLEAFQGPYDFAGGGAYGDKSHPRTKEQADYNLKYLSAVALLDGGVGPEQHDKERVLRSDVQDLLARVDVKPGADLTAEPTSRDATRRVCTSSRMTGGNSAASRPITKDHRHGLCHGNGSSTISVGLPSPSATKRCGLTSLPAVDRLDEITVGELAGLLGAVSSTARRSRSKARF